MSKKKRITRGRWKVYIEGQILPWAEHLTRKDAELYAKQFRKNGVAAAAQLF